MNNNNNNNNNYYQQQQQQQPNFLQPKNEGQQQQKPKPAQEYELYKRLKLLGEGSFGKAYLVESLSDGRKWVIKQISLDAMSPEEKKESFKEAKILEQLNHPNIVKFKEIYKTKSGKLCIVMEYADGGDLQDMIKKQRGKYFREEQILDWITQICLAMKHVHDRKILHRDLKGQNIFLTAQNICKLGDFGIARVLNKTFEKAKTMVGTPYYLSPEIINSVPYSFKSDVWSIGVVLYELAALKPPFSGDSLNNLALNIDRGIYQPIPSSYSSDLKKLVANLLQKKPESRYSIQQILNLPFIKNRIKNFLSETIKANEFSHTILHNQKIVLDDDFKNIKNVGGAPPPSVAYQLKEQRQANEKLEQQQKVLPNIIPSKPEENKVQANKPAPYKVSPQMNYQMRPQTPSNNQIRPVGVKNPSPSDQRGAQQAAKKPSSLDGIPNRLSGDKQPSSAQQAAIGKENSSENKRIVRQASKDMVIKNQNIGTESDDNNSQMQNPQIQQNKQPSNPSVPSGQLLKNNPSQQKIIQKVPSKPSFQKFERPQTAAQNGQKQIMTPKYNPSSKPLYPAKPSDRKQSAGQIAVNNPSKSENNNKPPMYNRPITAIQRNITPNKQINGVQVHKNIISKEEAAQKRIEHLRVVREQEEQKKRKLEEFKRAKLEASIKQKKESEIKRINMRKDIELKKKNNNEIGKVVVQQQQQQQAYQQEVQQRQPNKKQEIQIEWMGTLKPDQPPERPKYIDQRFEEQRVAADKYNREMALKKQKEEEIENKKRIQEQKYEDMQREKEKKQREMFLQEQMSENSNGQNYPQKGFAKIENLPQPAYVQNKNILKREEIEYCKMVEELKSIVDNDQSENETAEETEKDIIQNINYEETDRDDDDFDQESDTQGNEKRQKEIVESCAYVFSNNNKQQINQIKESFVKQIGSEDFSKLYKVILKEMKINKQFLTTSSIDKLKIIKNLLPSIKLEKSNFNINQLVDLIQIENY